MVDHAVFTSDWSDLFLGDFTYANDLSAEHYGLPAPGTMDFVLTSTAGTGRAGLFSQGAVASVGNHAMDTSPTKRGQFVRRRLMCDPVPPPPPSAPSDAPPARESGRCKVDRYAQHRDNPSCASCHQDLDDIGFGLERLDPAGAWRDHDYVPYTGGVADTACPLDGQGAVTELGAFQGPLELAEMLFDEGLIPRCGTTHLLAFAHGLDVEAVPPEAVTRLTDAFAASGWRFDTLLLDVVADPSFIAPLPSEASP